MGAASPSLLHWGSERARAGDWRGDQRVALLAPLPDGPPPSADFVRRCLAILARQGYRKVVTGALAPSEQGGFLAAGFMVEERLHLLGIELGPGLPPVPDGVPLVRGTRRRRDEALAVDQLCFSPFWRFDERGLEDAIAATPRARFRVALDGGRGEGRAVVGYAVCGRADRRGYVQRLAVHPAWQGRGVGQRLLLDGLHWLRRHGVRRAVVNTQVGNDVALALYHRIGFRDEPVGLSVLSAGLP